MCGADYGQRSDQRTNSATAIGLGISTPGRHPRRGPGQPCDCSISSSCLSRSAVRLPGGVFDVRRLRVVAYPRRIPLTDGDRTLRGGPRGIVVCLITNPRFCLNHHIPNWIEGIDMAEKKTPGNTRTIDDLKDPLFAAVGAVDLALEQLNEIIDAVRERTEEARSDASTRAEEARERLTKRRAELREQLSGEELRRTYESLVQRGEAAMERLRTRTRKAEAKKAPAKKSTKK